MCQRLSGIDSQAAPFPVTSARLKPASAVHTLRIHGFHRTLPATYHAQETDDETRRNDRTWLDVGYIRSGELGSDQACFLIYILRTDG